MKIYSKFKDYYDGILLSITSSDMVWDRSHNVGNLEKTLSSIKRLDLYERLDYLFFCGEIIPYYDYYSYNFVSNTNHTESCIYGEGNIIKSFRKESNRYYYYRDEMIKELFLYIKTIKSTIEEIQIQSNVPIFLVYRKNKEWQIEFNPNLSKINFYQYYDSWNTASKLDYYLNNVLVSDKIVETFSDSVKIISHGFDDKSFRNYSGKGLKKLKRNEK